MFFKLPFVVSFSFLFITIQYAVFHITLRTLYVSLYIYIYIYIYIKFTEASHHNTLNMTQNRWM